MRNALLAAAIVCLGVAVSSVPTRAQEGPPKPPPELKRVELFAGNWNFKGETKESPMGPAGEVTFKETCEMYEGGFALVCRSEGKNPMGPAKSLSIMSYDTEKKAYTYNAIESGGPPFTAYGQVTNGTWNWTSEGKMGGKMMKTKVTITEQGKDAYDFKMEMSTDGGAFQPIMEGKSTRSGT